MIFSLLPYSCGAYARVESEHAANAHEFLQMLGIADDGTSYDAPVTRAQFIDLVVKALNSEMSADIDGYFTDVSENHPLAASIYKAKAIGVISGKDSARFYPDATISQNEAAKVMACALGYMGVAEVRGGYPIGYLAVANDIGLLKRVGASPDAVTYGNAYIMVSNMMHAGKCETVGVSSGNLIYSPVSGNTVISENWGLESASGIIRVAGHVSMEPDFYSEESVVSIDGVMFKTDLQNLDEYLGLSAVGYYDEENKLKAIYKDSKNTIYTLTADEFISYNNFKITYAAENDTQLDILDVDMGFSFVKNGKALSCTKEDFEFENGTFNLIDSDGDDLIDCIIAKEITYMVVSGISNLYDSVYDLKKGKTVILKRNEGYYYELCDADGNDITPASLKENMVLTLLQSEDEKYVKAVAVLDSVKGTITEVNSDGTIKIDDNEYKLNNYFSGEFEAHAGMEGEFLLASDKTVVALSQKNSEMRYGYLISYFEDKNGLLGSSQILLLDQSGKYLEYTLEEKIKLDGTPQKFSDSAVRDALLNQGYPRYQLLKYKINDGGKISVIDTASAFESGTDAADKYTAVFDEENSLNIFVDNKNSYFYRTYNVFSPYATVGGQTLIFKVPKALADSQNSDPESDGRLQFYDKKYFTVESKTSLKDYGTYLVSIYDQSYCMQPGAVLLYDGGFGIDVNINRQSTSPYIVEKITDAINEDMEPVKKMTVWGKGAYKTFMLTKEFCDLLGEDGTPKPGDIIVMATNSFNEVLDVEIDVRYTGKKAEIKKASTNSNDYNYHTGKVFSTGDKTVLLKMESGPTYSATYGSPLDGIVSFSVNSGQTSYFVQYDVTNSVVNQIKQSDLKTILASGDNASNVVIYNYYHGASLVVEYIK